MPSFTTVGEHLDRYGACMQHLKRISRVLLLVGAVAVVAGIVQFVVMSPDPSGDAFLSGRVSFDDVVAHNNAEARAIASLMLGAFCLLAGFGFSPRARRMQLELAAESAEVVTRGVRRGLENDSASPADRLRKLAELHAQGLITDAELEARRHAVIDAV
jgi:hypothetical protein